MQEIVVKFNEQELKLTIRDEADQSVMREIFKLREYKSAEEIIKSSADPILDIGAHVGFFSLYCRILNPEVLIYAVEPLKENLIILNKHLKVNKIEGVKVVESAMAYNTEKRKLVVTEDNHNNFLGEEGDREVQAYGFRDFCLKNKITRVSLLKIDIEGGEYEILDSLEAGDFAKIFTMILEYHDGERNHKELEEKLRENGFGVQVFPSRFDKKMGYIFAMNKRLDRDPESLPRRAGKFRMTVNLE